jgi:hypothetical protein
MEEIDKPEFTRRILNNPGFAENLSEKIEITHSVYLKNSEITHLSPHLYFANKDMHGVCAKFENCKNLKVACGEFNGVVNFQESGIHTLGPIKATGIYVYHCDILHLQEFDPNIPVYICSPKTLETLAKVIPLPKIETATHLTANEFNLLVHDNPSVFKTLQHPIEVTQYIYAYNSPITHLSKHLTFSGENPHRRSASFIACNNLKNASGTYQHKVDFSNSGIQSIENLKIHNPDETGVYAQMNNCPNLTSLENWDMQNLLWIEDEKWKAEQIRRKKLRSILKSLKPPTLPL